MNFSSNSLQTLGGIVTAGFFNLFCHFVLLSAYHRDISRSHILHQSSWPVLKVWLNGTFTTQTANLHSLWSITDLSSFTNAVFSVSTKSVYFQFLFFPPSSSNHTEECDHMKWTEKNLNFLREISFLKRWCGGFTVADYQVSTKMLSHSYSSKGRKIRWKILSQDKGILIGKTKGCVHRQRITRIVILYFPSAGSVQTFPGRQGLIMHSDFFWRQTSS